MKSASVCFTYNNLPNAVYDAIFRNIKGLPHKYRNYCQVIEGRNLSNSNYRGLDEDEGRNLFNSNYRGLDEDEGKNLSNSNYRGLDEEDCQVIERKLL